MWHLHDFDHLTRSPSPSSSFTHIHFHPMGDETATSPWGIYALFIFCTFLSISGFVWCVCCGTWWVQALLLSQKDIWLKL